MRTNQNNLESITLSGNMNPEIFKQLVDLLDCEIELLQGMMRANTNGMIEFEMELSGYKADIARDFIQALISLNTQEVKISIMGVPLNKN